MNSSHIREVLSDSLNTGIIMAFEFYLNAIGSNGGFYLFIILGIPLVFHAFII